MKTPRLTLRRFSHSDIEQLVSCLNDKEMTKSMAAIPYPYDVKMAEGWIQYCQEEEEKNPKTSFNYAIEKISGKELIGSISIFNIVENKSAEFGFWVRRKHWNNGYVTEAVRRVIKHAFDELKFKRLTIKTFKNNDASARVAKKLCFQYAGETAKGRLCISTGQRQPEKIYALESRNSSLKTARTNQGGYS